MIDITDAAAAKINEIVNSEEEATLALRIMVQGGGCSGFQYNFALDDSPKQDDTVIEHNGATLLIDPMSIMYLDGATLDYQKDLMNEQFTLSNPNVKSTCGCNQSFSV